MDKVQIGLLGCGRISTNHIDAISKLPEAKLVTVFDTVKELAVRTGIQERRYACF